MRDHAPLDRPQDHGQQEQQQQQIAIDQTSVNDATAGEGFNVSGPGSAGIFGQAGGVESPTSPRGDQC
jgi:hypothetical protein